MTAEAPADPSHRPQRPASASDAAPTGAASRLRLLLPDSASFSAAAWCSKRQVAVCTDQRDASVSFAIANRAAHDVTVTLDVDLVNMACDREHPVTLTIPAARAQEVLLARAMDRAKAFRWKFSFEWVPGALDAGHDEATPYELPFPEGTSSRVIQGARGAFSHSGECEHAIDFDLQDGSPVTAARAGRVVGARSDSSRGGADRKLADQANYVLIRHDDGSLAEYVHLRRDGVLVGVGDEVAAGHVIGLAGSTGFSTGPHLHFMVYKARDGRSRMSLPVRFRVGESAAEPLSEGRVYVAPPRSGQTTGTSAIAIR